MSSTFRIFWQVAYRKVNDAAFTTSRRTTCGEPCNEPAYSDKEHGRSGAVWMILSLGFAIPAVVLGSVYTYFRVEQEEHDAEKKRKKLLEESKRTGVPPVSEYVPYEYLNIRHKRFPWGDGQRSFFYNPKVNVLPGERYPQESPFLMALEKEGEVKARPGKGEQRKTKPEKGEQGTTKPEKGEQGTTKPEKGEQGTTKPKKNETDVKDKKEKERKEC